MLEVERVGPGEFVLTGELTMENAEGFREEVQTDVTPGATVTLHIAELDLLDSSGIRELVIIRKGVAPEGRVVLRAPTNHVGRVLQIAGLSAERGFDVVDRIVDLRETLEAMPVESRDGLLRVITAHPSFRGRVIERLHAIPEKQEWADVLLILDSDPEARDIVVSLLEADRSVT